MQLLVCKRYLEIFYTAISSSQRVSLTFFVATFSAFRREDIIEPNWYKTVFITQIWIFWCATAFLNFFIKLYWLRFPIFAMLFLHSVMGTKTSSAKPILFFTSSYFPCHMRRLSLRFALSNGRRTNEERILKSSIGELLIIKERVNDSNRVFNLLFHKRLIIR